MYQPRMRTARLQGIAPLRSPLTRFRAVHPTEQVPNPRLTRHPLVPGAPVHAEPIQEIERLLA